MKEIDVPAEMEALSTSKIWKSARSSMKSKIKRRTHERPSGVHRRFPNHLIVLLDDGKRCRSRSEEEIERATCSSRGPKRRVVSTPDFQGLRRRRVTEALTKSSVLDHTRSEQDVHALRAEKEDSVGSRDVSLEPRLEVHRMASVHVLVLRVSDVSSPHGLCRTKEERVSWRSKRNEDREKKSKAHLDRRGVVSFESRRRDDFSESIDISSLMRYKEKSATFDEPTVNQSSPQAKRYQSGRTQPQRSTFHRPSSSSSSSFQLLRKQE